MSRIISFVQCVGEKEDTPQLAKDLYTSQLFVNASAYAEKISDEWHIISAEHGLVNPSVRLAPYDVTLKKMGIQQRREWADRVFSDLKPLLQPTDKVVILAGVIYRENLVDKIKGLGCKVEIPMEGLRIGEQVSWLKGKLTDN